jgi:hypothetical protein
LKPAALFLRDASVKATQENKPDEKSSCERQANITRACVRRFGWNADLKQTAKTGCYGLV